MKMTINPQQQLVVDALRKLFDIKDSTSTQEIIGGMKKFQNMSNNPQKPLEEVLRNLKAPEEQ